MTSQRLSLIALAIATTLSAGHALASDAPKTREQVRAELAQAQRDGTLIADGQTGATFRDLAPHRYAPAATVQAKTRVDVRAELEAARQAGELIADGETGAKARDLFPGAYAASADVRVAQAGTAEGKTRAQVRAEFEAARRNGDLIADGQTGATFRQLTPHLFPVQDSALAKSREQVRDELAQSRREGAAPSAN